MDSALQLKQQKQRGKKRKPNKNKVSVRPEKKPRADTSTINATTTTAATTTNPMFRVHWWNNSTSLNPPHQESRGRDLLANLLRINADLFESEYWLKKPYVRHLTPQERKESFSNKSHPVYMLQMSDIDTLLHRKEPNPPRFLNDVDVTRYSAVGDKKEALAEGNPPADPQQVWGAFNEDGYSVRLVHPQQWHQPLFELCSYLQEYFGFPTGCSSYLTPAGSQGSEYYETILNCITGYPAHYDDVEIFVIQLEGKKRWRLYERSDKDTNVSARVTKAFGQEELHKPVADFVMEPGDIMYFPRGTVHQAVSCDGAHSLHVTFSTYQELEEEAKTNRWLHTCLPLCLLDNVHVGIPKAPAWNRLKSYLVTEDGKPAIPKRLLKQVRKLGSLEFAIDVIAREFYMNCLPPANPNVKPLDLESANFDRTRIALTARHCTRLIDNNPSCAYSLKDWDKIDPNDSHPDIQLALYFNTSNGRAFASPPSPQLEVLPCLASSLLQLLDASTSGVLLKDLKALQCEGERKESMLDLLDLMSQYSIITVCK